MWAVKPYWVQHSGSAALATPDAPCTNSGAGAGGCGGGGVATVVPTAGGGAVKMTGGVVVIVVVVIRQGRLSGRSSSRL